MINDTIGKMCSLIFQAGYSIHLSQDERSILLIIGTSVNGASHTVNWHVSRADITSMHEAVLIDVIEEKIEALKRSYGQEA